ncbi:hypothetical protein B0H19DRAFT_52738 [Mycena capillaripes]|nr:hypothetical protein B0H19DRAFT_52738 [Mycena capillaripes]
MADNHDSKLYFDGGDIVLSAKNSDGHTTYFRLYKGILVKHSPVFADMFTMPPPPNVEKYNGIPLVEMPDNANALRGLMSILFDPECVSEEPSLFASANLLYCLSRYTSEIFDARDFTVQLLGPTILAKKYQIDWIVKRVAFQLLKRWPTTVVGWDRLDQEEEQEDSLNLHGHWDTFSLDGITSLRQFPEPVSSILLARECDAPAILPFAFFNLLAFPLVSPDEQMGVYYSSKAVPHRDLVSPEDWRRMFFARAKIGDWFWAEKESNNSWKPCGGDKRCATTYSSTWSLVASEMNPTGDFLRSARQAARKLDRSPDNKICPACKQKLQDQIRRLRLAFVDELSTFFQLAV